MGPILLFFDTDEDNNDQDLKNIYYFRVKFYMINCILHVWVPFSINFS